MNYYVTEETVLTKREELDVFMQRINEFIESKYILADIKIVNLLKSIAASETLLALFKNCLTGFDYEAAKKKYLVKSPYLSDSKGEFVLPPNPREILAFIFNILVDIDAKRIILSEFLSKYFYEDGSCYAGYSAFINSMIRPFGACVETLMESVIEGSLQDPVEAVNEAEENLAKQKELDEIERKKDEELQKKSYGKNAKKIKELLLIDKKKVKESNLNPKAKEEALLVIDMLANVVESMDKDAVNYAFVAYKNTARIHKILFFGRVKKIGKLLNV